MAEALDRRILTPTGNEEVPSSKHTTLLPWHRFALGAVVLLAIFMDFFQLGQNGYGNLYYAAGVKSMADSWHNFFFVSFDPGGFVTIDKPPLGFWLQTLSTKIFGFTAFSIFLPQALCGVLAVLLLFFLVRRHFGVVAGLIAALALAVTPISVVTDRNNTIDGTLALALLLAAWAVIHAAERGKLRWLLLSAVFVGVGFNIKMAEAYLVVPAILLTYLLCAPRKLWTRIWQVVLAGIVILLLSLSWAAAVDLTPASARPYVGSTQTNSELSLAFGYNGLSRLHIFGLGGNGFGGGAAPGGLPLDLSSTGSLFTAGSFEPLRLFSASLGGQIAWLLPFALLGILALAWQRRWRFRQDHQQLALVLWGFWLLTMAVFFTLDANFHQYYMTEMAPGLCALVGIGLVSMWQDYRSGGWRGWLLPFALVVTAAAQVYLLASYPTWASWLSPLIIIVTVLAVLGLIFFRLRPRLNLGIANPRLAMSIVGLGLAGLLLAPAIWSGYSVIMNTESSFPTAGPNAVNGATNGFALTGQNGFGGARGGGFRDFGQGNPGGGAGIGTFNGGSAQVNQGLVTYLKAHQGNTKFLVATPSASTAESIILATNLPVMAMGGFSGNDPILTTSKLQSLINQNIVHYFLISGGRGGGFGGFGGGGGRGGQSSPSSWVASNCSAVPASAWTTSTGAGQQGSQLYDCISSAT
jgi:4-amino-4-deoxy-L-arabinose transferase-like glycosyltransferase